MPETQVILVDENDKPVGEMEKLEAHKKAQLHRAFSIFVFNRSQELLLQQRSENKYHSAGLWTNTCCGHPMPNENTKRAAERRLFEEMGFTTSLKKLFAFTYRAEFENGLTEFEYDHVFIGEYSGDIFPNDDEVKTYRFAPLGGIEIQLKENPALFSVWFQIVFPKIVKKMNYSYSNS